MRWGARSRETAPGEPRPTGLGPSGRVVDADQKAIKDAFRQLAWRYHPDRNKEPGAEECCEKMAGAYAVLSDPQKRAEYDARGVAGAPASRRKTCSAASLEVSVSDNSVTIRAEIKREEKETGEYYYHEMSSGTFARTISLPAAVDAKLARVQLKNGILEMTMPKTEAEKRHKIAIKEG
jgi:DnaJ-class molecular chaperone